MSVLSALAAVLLVTASLEAATDARLAEAAMRGDLAAVKALVGQRVDVNAPGADGTPALHWLVRADDLESVRLLIRSGADVKAENRYGVTPLYLAVTNGNGAMVGESCRFRGHQRPPPKFRLLEWRERARFSSALFQRIKPRLDSRDNARWVPSTRDQRRSLSARASASPSNTPRPSAPPDARSTMAAY